MLGDGSGLSRCYESFSSIHEDHLGAYLTQVRSLSNNDRCHPNWHSHVLEWS